MLFWILISAIALGATVLLATAWRRGRTDAMRPDEPSKDLALYRDQLAEIDRDRARGVITDDEAERVRVEVSRRLLAADRAVQGAAEGARGPVGPLVAVAAVAGIGALGTYAWLGAPHYPDWPLARRLEIAAETKANRPHQDALVEQFGTPWSPPSDADPDFLALMDKLRAAVAERPDDAQGLELLARNEANLGNYVAAAEAQQKLIAVRGDSAVATDYSTLAALMVLAAGGMVSPEAEAALTKALQMEPSNGTARYYTGLLFAQTGRPDLAFRMWRPLLEESPPDAPWVAPIRAQILEVAQLAGVRYSLPPETAQPGPSAEDVQNAQDMTPEERQQMIRGMVEGLAQRLADEGGPAADWARLIRALGVLGETERAQKIYAEARDSFTDDPAGLAQIDAAAVAAGIKG